MTIIFNMSQKTGYFQLCQDASIPINWGYCFHYGWSDIIINYGREHLYRIIIGIL
jgi:hypothetical protein